MSKTEFSAEELMALADLLMGAALADGEFHRREASFIKNLLAMLMETNELPDQLDDYLQRFDPAEFDLETCCQVLDADTPERRAAILRLVARVTEMDSVLDLDESAYVVQVARKLGASEEEYGQWVVEFSADEGEGSKPPPLPEG